MLASNMLNVDLVTFVYFLKGLFKKLIEFPLVCFCLKQQAKVTKSTLSILDLVNFSWTSQM